jgi:pSer/pThr/pTyr-binding forkhead associated (FHA) protein
MATLFVLQGRDQGKCFELRGSSLTIGRDRGNAIQLSDSEVSRNHAEIRADDDGFLLVDLASSNGSFVNAEQVTRTGPRRWLTKSISSVRRISRALEFLNR